MVQVEILSRDIDKNKYPIVSSKDFFDITYLQKLDTSNVILTTSFFDSFHGISLDVLEYLNAHFSTIYIQSTTPISIKYKLNLLLHGGKRSVFEEEWARYKYKVLEFSVKHYQATRAYFKEATVLDAKEFYQILEDAFLYKNENFFENAALHVFGYFKKDLSTDEKKDFLNLLKDFKTETKKDAIREVLYNYTVKYNKKYLKESYFFLSNQK